MISFFFSFELSLSKSVFSKPTSIDFIPMLASSPSIYNNIYSFKLMIIYLKYDKENKN